MCRFVTHSLHSGKLLDFRQEFTSYVGFSPECMCCVDHDCNWVDCRSPFSASLLAIAKLVSMFVVIGIVLSTIVTSSATTPLSSASANSSSFPPLYPPSGGLTLRASAALLTPEVGLVVCMIRPAGSLLLPYGVSLVACTFFAHLC